MSEVGHFAGRYDLVAIGSGPAGRGRGRAGREARASARH